MTGEQEEAWWGVLLATLTVVILLGNLLVWRLMGNSTASSPLPCAPVTLRPRLRASLMRNSRTTQRHPHMPWERFLSREKARLVHHPRDAELVFSRLYPNPADQGEVSISLCSPSSTASFSAA